MHEAFRNPLPATILQSHIVCSTVSLLCTQQWLNFGSRQLVTLELARITQWIVLDGLIGGLPRYSIQLLGSLVQHGVGQGQGWPFIMASWAIWDLCLLHGNNPFQTHWLFWTGLEIYSEVNSGAGILSSSAYLRILLCMLLAGCAVMVKRTVMTITFSRRQYGKFCHVFSWEFTSDD